MNKCEFIVYCIGVINVSIPVQAPTIGEKGTFILKRQSQAGNNGLYKRNRHYTLIKRENIHSHPQQ